MNQNRDNQNIANEESKENTAMYTINLTDKLDDSTKKMIVVTGKRGRPATMKFATYDEAFEAARAFEVANPFTDGSVRYSFEIVEEVKVKKVSKRQREHELAIWVEEQKAAYWNDGLTEEQVRLLEEIPGWDWGSNPAMN